VSSTARREAPNEVHAAVGGLVLGALYVIMVIVVDGVVMKLTWNWFVPVIFAGAPHLNLAQAIGLGLVPTAFFGSARPWKKSTPEESVALMKGAAFKYVTILVLGYIIHAYFL